jgi:hypothetical protein
MIQKLTALHIATILGIRKLADDVLEKNSDPSPRDSAGRTPLMLAAAHGNFNILELLLLRSEVDVNCTDLEGKTALGYAMEHSQPNAVQILLSSAQLLGLDINFGSPFLDACNNLGNDKREESQEILKLLLPRADLDVNPEPAAGWGTPPWYRMAINWDIDTLQALLARTDFVPYKWDSDISENNFFLTTLRIPTTSVLTV